MTKQSTLKDTINKKVEELKGTMGLYEQTLKLIEKYPDLHEKTDRWNKRRLCSKKVNGVVNKCFIKHSCGCCADSPLEVWPYIIEGNILVFSDPCGILIGEANACGSGEIPNEGWQEDLREESISEEVINQVQKYLDENPPQPYDDEDDDW